MARSARHGHNLPRQLPMIHWESGQNIAARAYIYAHMYRYTHTLTLSLLSHKETKVVSVCVREGEGVLERKKYREKGIDGEAVERGMEEEGETEAGRGR